MSMAGTKTTSQLRVELHQVQEEVKALRSQEMECQDIKAQLERTLEKLKACEDELYAQNEQMGKMQTELERSHHKYFDLFEGAPIGYFTLNHEGCILEANMTGADMLGYERKLLLQTHMSKYFKQTSQNDFSDHLQNVFSDVFSDSIELECEHGGAKPLFVMLESVPIYGKESHVIECRTAMMDITERKRLEKQLYHAQKLESLGTLAGGIAHDFNNLLTVISSHAGLAGRALKAEGVGKSHLEKIEKAALRGDKLTSQMLTYSGRDTQTRESMNLTDLVVDLNPLLQVACSTGVVLSRELDQELPLIQGDQSQIRQVVLNLITNALESLSDAKGTIAITTGLMEVSLEYLRDCCFVADLPAHKSVYLEVTDGGIGMNPELMKKIFDPFFSTKFMGRGMGLADVAGIMRTHGGAIHVWSDVGVGTSFRVHFPIAPQSVVVAREMSEEVDESWTGHGLFLVVDDEEDICIAAESILQQLGFDVLTAQDGREGIRLFQEHAAELSGVLLDLTMPYLNGKEVFDEIRQISTTVPVILSSGYTEDDVLNRFNEQPVDGFIQKPYLLDTLINTVKQVLGP